MNWEDEPYVRLYQRDTLTWKIWPWQSRAIFPSIIRKLDRAGVMDIGDTDPFEAIAVMIDFPLDVVRIGLDPIFQKGTLRISKGQLVAPNYIEAQEARASDRARQRLSRERRRDKANVTDRDKQSHKTVTKRDDRQKQCDNRSQNVTEAKVTKRDEVITKRDTTSQNVRNCHNSSHAVTPSPPSLTPSEFQDQRECSPGARAREDNPSTNHTHTHTILKLFFCGLRPAGYLAVLEPGTGRVTSNRQDTSNPRN